VLMHCILTLLGYCLQEEQQEQKPDEEKKE
jgi:hypothetical protein